MKKPLTLNFKVLRDFEGKQPTEPGLIPLLKDIIKEVRDSKIMHPKGDPATCKHRYTQLDRYWNQCHCGTLKPTENI